VDPNPNEKNWFGSTTLLLALPFIVKSGMKLCRLRNPAAYPIYHSLSVWLDGGECVGMVGLTKHLQHRAGLQQSIRNLVNYKKINRISGDKVI
jgi:hypothetical protein